jgi:hypothetical protein
LTGTVAARVESPYLLVMPEPELTKEELDRRAGELAQRVMSKPPQPHVWPKKAKPDAKPARSGASKPRKRERAAVGS